MIEVMGQFYSKISMIQHLKLLAIEIWHVDVPFVENPYNLECCS